MKTKKLIMEFTKIYWLQLRDHATMNIVFYYYDANIFYIRMVFLELHIQLIANIPLT